MGIDTAGSQFLLGAKRLGVDFSRSLTLGRQFLSPESRELAQMLRWYGSAVEAAELLTKARGWSEAFFEFLGAQSVDSLDASSFEGATIVQDLNADIDESLKRRFSVVFDGGTLEHVFDFPRALRNCMEMISEGGWFLQTVPANNFMGHGFYQISPELVYRAFSPANGFRIVIVLLSESVRGGRWYTVRDPADVGHRVQMTNSLPMSMFTIARRTACVPIFDDQPIQADYARGWRPPDPASARVYGRGPSLHDRLAQMVERYAPAPLERAIRNLYVPSLEAQPDSFRRIAARDLVRGVLPEMR